MCYRATSAHPALSLCVNAPILLPSLHLLSSVAVADNLYWKTKFLPGENDDWSDLRFLLSKGGHMRVKRKEGSGCLTKTARLTPWSLGKAKREKLRSSGRTGDRISFTFTVHTLTQATGKHTANCCSRTVHLLWCLHLSVFCLGIEYKNPTFLSDSVN